MNLGERLRGARRRKGLSLRKLAVKVKVSAQAISKYERNLDTPSSPVLIRLSRALGVSIERLLRPQKVVLTNVSYRCHKTRLTKSERETIQEEVSDWLERYLAIEEILGQRSKFDLKKIVIPIKGLEDAESAAEKLRRLWHLGEDPIPHLIYTCEEHGIRVGLVAGPKAFDAMAFFANDSIPVIVVNRGLPGDRQRLSIAHELGHLVLQVPGDWPEKDVERAAFRFAGAFLMPRGQVFWELGRHRSHLEYWKELYLLKHRYGISMQAIVRRAYDLGVIEEYVYRSICRSFRQQGWHEKEPGAPYPPEKTDRLEQLVFRALNEGLISRRRAEELLGRALSDS